MRSRRVTAIGAGVAAVGAALLAYLLFFSDWPGGMRPSYAASDYDPRLTREAKAAVPIANAAKKYFAANAAYPATAAQFQSDLPSTSRLTPDGGIDGWRYAPAPGNRGFSLRRRLGWDPSFEYRWDGTAESWVFDPGDGRPTKTIALRP